ncbi:hypothetical protein ACOMHN_024555 [Nucella lapillus]
MVNLGACRADDSTAESLLIARSVTTAVLCLLPLLISALCYTIVIRSVWLAREVRTESASEYNRVIFVTLLRLLSLVLTYLPVCLVFIAEVRSGLIPEAAHWVLGHFLWLQSVLSPFVTLQDNDFREKMMVPNKHAPGGGGGVHKNGVGEDGGVGVMPDIGSSGGQDGEEHRARNLQELNREMRRSQLQRGLSFITSADMHTIRGSSD